ncbi:MAG: hypothetical protein WC865_17700 [Bacteroidales bacterium]
MKTKLFIILLVVFTIPSFSQSTNTQNDKLSHRSSVQFELFGHGMLYSLNYEYVVINRNRLKTTAQVGFSYYPPSTGYRPTWIPISINELISFGKHHIELGIGHVFITEMGHDVYGEDRREWEGFFSGRLGYRYQKPNGRLIIRAGFTPLYEYSNDHAFHPSGGLAVGYSF